MNAIFLPGNSSRNESWIDKLSENMKPLYRRAYTHKYLHWDTEDTFVEFDLELAIISEKAIDYEPYFILAKSVGALLSIKGIYEGALFPQKCVLLGMPHDYMQQSDLPINDWLKYVSVPCLVLQNEKDPVGTYSETASYIDKIGNGRIMHKKMPGDDHNYDDFDALRKELTDFL